VFLDLLHTTPKKKHIFLLLSISKTEGERETERGFTGLFSRERSHWFLQGFKQTGFCFLPVLFDFNAFFAF
jgi:hypothetical protein